MTTPSRGDARASIDAVPAPAAEIAVTAELAHALLMEQHADLAELRVTWLASGWDNEIFRLGDDLLVRLPRRAVAAPLEENEQRWLPALAADLPLPVPVPRRAGTPSEHLGYPWSWSVRPWFEGVPAEHAGAVDPEALAVALGGFLAALHQPAPSDAPPNPYRGVPLADRSAQLERDLQRPGTDVDAAAVRSAWAALVDTSRWGGPPLWLHGDVHPLNLLVHNGILSAVIDFGDLTAGDPASDLAVAWMLLPPTSRNAFRQACGAVDDPTWARARGWALALGVSMAGGDDRVRTIGERSISAVLADLD